MPINANPLWDMFNRRGPCYLRSLQLRQKLVDIKYWRCFKVLCTRENNRRWVARTPQMPLRYKHTEIEFAIPSRVAIINYFGGYVRLSELVGSSPSRNWRDVFAVRIFG